jgi:hypothetical protein
LKICKSYHSILYLWRCTIHGLIYFHIKEINRLKFRKEKVVKSLEKMVTLSITKTNLEKRENKTLKNLSSRGG